MKKIILAVVAAASLLLAGSPALASPAQLHIHKQVPSGEAEVDLNGYQWHYDSAGGYLNTSDTVWSSWTGSKVDTVWQIASDADSSKCLTYSTSSGTIKLEGCYDAADLPNHPGQWWFFYAESTGDIWWTGNMNAFSCIEAEGSSAITVDTDCALNNSELWNPAFPQ